MELKWCWEKGTFPNCLWDVLKLASALQAGSLSEGYLLVGGCGELFDKGELGTEPFLGQPWSVDTRDFFTAPGPVAWFAKWRREVIARPRRVPAGVRTVFVGAETEGSFRIALARVEIADDRVLLVSEGGQVEEPRRP